MASSIGVVALPKLYELNISKLFITSLECGVCLPPLPEVATYNPLVELDG